MALPIMLVLLVMSLMGNILLMTKNIEHSRGNEVEAGEVVYDGFVQSRDHLAVWSGYMDQVVAPKGGEASLSRLSASHLASLVASDEGGLSVLMASSAEIGGAEYADAAQQYEGFRKKLAEELAAIGNGNGPLQGSELEKISAVQALFVQLTEQLGQFHYEMEGDRNSLIRLSAGHDWLEIAKELQKTVLSYSK